MRSVVTDAQLIAACGPEDPVSILAVPVTMGSQRTFLFPQFLHQPDGLKGIFLQEAVRRHVDIQVYQHHLFKQLPFPH